MQQSRVAMLSIMSIFAVVAPASAQLIAPDQPVAGQSQLSLAEQWYRWNIEQPVETNPVFDNTGAQAFRGDQGSVFFLTAAFSAGPIQRTIIVPAGEPLFAPIFGATNDNTTPPGQAPTTFSAAELVAALDPLFNPQNMSSLFAQVDGVSQGSLYNHRLTTDPSAPFSYTTTSRDNFIDEVTGSDSTFGTGVFPSTVFPVVGDGYWIALEPFAPGGTHTLNFGGEGVNVGTEDITYVITTTPEPTTGLAVAGLLIDRLGPAVAPRVLAN